MKRLLFNLFLIVAVCLLPVYGATITVTNTNDAGAGSLRQAIADAGAGDTINFSVTGTITVVTTLEINKNLTITGPGSGSLTISGNNSVRVFYLRSGNTINISDITIANGTNATYGGGIENESTLNLTDCVVTGCRANGSGNGYGAGLDNYGGTATVTRCTFTNNTANNEGGAIAGYNGSIEIIDSTISGNTSDNGGGISQLNAATLTITRSTISGNHASGGGNKNGGGLIVKQGNCTITNSTISGNDAENGGAIADGASASITIVSCTIVNNSATAQGGGLDLRSTVSMKNTILASNTAPTGADFNNAGGGINSQGYNLCDGALASFSGTGDQTNATLNIAALANNGGNTQTHMLNAGSDAIDAIPEGGNTYNGSPSTDQRGVSRPQGANADVGAVEAPQAPTVTTQAVNSIASTTATGNGNITDLGAPDPTAYGVCWSTSTNPTTSDSKTDEGGTSSTGAFTTSMTGLTPNTTYYVKAYATNSNGTGYGNEVSFTTDAVPPAVTTQAVTSIAATTATGNGNITSLGVPNPTAHGVCWSTSTNPTTGDSLSNKGAASSTGAFTANMTSLSPNTTYYVRAFAINAGGTVYGTQVSFTTSPQAATVTTQAVTSITTTTATGNGNITALGAPNPTAHGICWHTSSGPTTANSSTNSGAASSTGAFTGNITGLSAYTTYYVRAYATNSAGTVYGNEVSFTTSAITPTITTQAVTSITAISATGNGNITDLGVPNPTSHGFCWNTGGTPTTGDSVVNRGAASSTGAFTANITGLSGSTTYYVRAFAINAGGTVYGAQVSFTTNATPPTVTTQAVTSITATTATGNGNITALGSVNPTAHGVCWSTSTNPTTSDSSTNSGAASSTGAFTGNITGLTAYTTYYVRAYATNSGGTTYGNQVSFTTSAITPTVTTQAATSVTATTATGNGNITDLGVPNPTAHGVCWNTGGTPTTGDSLTNEGGASSTGAFTTNITGLTGSTTYYVRAYATNAGGTVYGNQVSFTTNATPPVVTTQTVSSIAATTATGNGNITSLGTVNPTAHGVCWNTSGTPTTSDSSSNEGGASATGAFTSNITGLTAYTTYYVRAYATNSGGTSYGTEVSFTTLGVEPTVTTQAVSSITSTTATGNGNITDLGTPNPTAHGVCWNTTGTPTTTDSKTDEGGASSTGAFTTSMTGLTGNTTYYVRAYATNAQGISYGTEVSFTTAHTPATVTTQAVSAIAANTATGNGDLTALGTVNPTAHGVCWNTSGTPTTSDSSSNEGASSSTGTFSSAMTGLSAGTTYYVRAYATNSGGTSYGTEVSFTTLTVTPVVTTQAASGVTENSATGNGSISDLGAPNPTSHGVCWNTSGSPTVNDSKKDNGAATSTGAFTAEMSGLVPNTKYYVRAFASNSNGTGYGETVTFTTDGSLPAVSTTKVTKNGSDKVLAEGEVKCSSNLEITERGFCCGKSPMPDIKGGHMVCGKGEGKFKGTIDRLKPNTRYYVRAYAVNSCGVAYGNQIIIDTGSGDQDGVDFVDLGTGSEVSGSVDLKVTIKTDKEITGVEFYLDGTKIGDGTPDQDRGDDESLLKEGDFYYSNSTNRLRRIDSTGNVSDAVRSDQSAEYVAGDSVGNHYVVFSSPVKLSDGNSYWMVKSDSNGICKGLEKNRIWFTASCREHSVPVQADNYGNIYYLISRSDGTSGMIRVTADGSRTVHFSIDSSVRAWSCSGSGDIAVVKGDSSYSSSTISRYSTNGSKVSEISAGDICLVTGNDSGEFYYSDCKSGKLNIYEDKSGELKKVELNGLGLNSVRTLDCLEGRLFISGEYEGVIRLYAVDPVTGSIKEADIDGMSVNRIWSGPGGKIRLLAQADGYNQIGDLTEEVSDWSFRGNSEIRDNITSITEGRTGSVDSEDSEAKKYICNWDSSRYEEGEHTLKVVVTFADGTESVATVDIKIVHLTIELTAERMIENAWIIKREYGRVKAKMGNISSDSDYLFKLLSKEGSGEYRVVKEFRKDELEDGVYTYMDKYLKASTPYTYKIEVYNSSNVMIQSSKEVSL